MLQLDLKMTGLELINSKFPKLETVDLICAILIFQDAKPIHVKILSKLMEYKLNLPFHIYSHYNKAHVIKYELAKFFDIEF